jgi:hypothetical protein
VAAADTSVAALLEAVLERTGYRQWLADDGIFFEPTCNLAGEVLNAAVNFLCRNQNIQLCCHACAPFA